MLRYGRQPTIGGQAEGAILRVAAAPLEKSPAPPSWGGRERGSKAATLTGACLSLPARRHHLGGACRCHVESDILAILGVGEIPSAFPEWGRELEPRHPAPTTNAILIH